MKIIGDKVQDGIRIVTAATEGVCSVQINLALQGDTIVDAMFYGGCNGNLQGICALARGQKIGTMGNTGNVYPVPSSYNPYGGTHLHFSVRIGSAYGSHINPLNLY